jgi:6-phosphogluconolactonase
MNRPDVHIHRDAAALFRASAELIATELETDLRQAGAVTFVLAGGNTPRGVYELLADKPYRDRVDWSRIHFFWGDERCVPPDSPESNYRMAYDRLISKISVPDLFVHRIRAELEDPEQSAFLYEAEIGKFLPPPQSAGFNLVLLGMGVDGHTASLFPGSHWIGQRLVVPTIAPSFPARRISMTPHLLNAARRIVFLVSGSQKAQALARVIGDPSCDLPATKIRPITGRLTWMVDEAAASLLSSGRTFR